MAGFAGGSAVLLAGLLLVAGVLKLLRPRPFAHAVHRLLPRHLVRRGAIARVAPWLVGGVEVLAAAGLLAVPGRWPAGFVAVLYLGFVAVVVIAIRTGTSCGCFTSFSDGAAGGAELGRTLALATLAVLSVAAGGAGAWWRLDALIWLVALAALVGMAAALGGRTRPSGALLLGRVDSRLAEVDLPALVDPRERTEVVATARESPSVRAFESWLGDRVSDVDWRRCEVRSGGATPPGGPHVPCLLVVPRCRVGLSVTVSVPRTNGRHAVVIAVLDGRPVSAIAGRVLVSGQRPTA